MKYKVISDVYLNMSLRIIEWQGSGNNKYIFFKNFMKSGRTLEGWVEENSGLVNVI